ncbi:tRNA methyltransferase 10 [Thoreauomyces humboldtii]|nr:tRNA methyltransferase 10 [Thoreauomyces humboldtii]
MEMPAFVEEVFDFSNAPCLLCQTLKLQSSAMDREPGQETITGMDAQNSAAGATDELQKLSPIIQEFGTIKSEPTFDGQAAEPTDDALVNAKPEPDSAVHDTTVGTADDPMMLSALKQEPLTIKSESTVDNHPAKPIQDALGSAEQSAEEEPDMMMSKKARKRKLKEEKYLADKPARDEARRKKRKEIKEKKKERRDLEAEQGIPKPPAKPRYLPAAIPSSMGLIIDLDFVNKMSDKELRSTASQAARCYSVNRHSSRPVQLHFTAFRGEVRKCLARSDPAYERWVENGKTPMTFHESDDLTVAGSAESLVYLTADSPNTLTDLDESKNYIIGGIVDKNRHKYLCFNKAKSLGIPHAKLPIEAYLNMATRKVLTINHVCEIMLKYLETKDWKASFLHAIPARKGFTVIDGEASNDEEGDLEGDAAAE